MQEINKNVENRWFYDSTWLFGYAAKVLNNLKRPFDSFEKAKYIMYRYGNDLPLYWFTTSIYSLEECIEIMKNKFDDFRSPEAYCKIYQIQAGKKKLVYTSRPIDKP